ncbi:hypothetical protein T484DRAFT_1637910, partial [Baffinella frigidus]
PETRTPNPETWNPNPKIRNPEPETRNPKPSATNPKPKPPTGNLEQERTLGFFMLVLRKVSLSLRLYQQTPLSLSLSTGRVFMINTRGQRNLLHKWILLVIIKAFV